MRRLRPLACVAAVAVAGATVAACTPTAGGPISVNEVYPRPASGVFRLSGHGWGHGHGMSQWGAEGAATLGKSADEILATYYPGTAKTLIANSSIRVLLSGDDSTDEQVLPAAGLTVSDGAGRRLVLPTGPRRWRVLADAAGLHLQRLDSAWTTVPVSGAASLASPVRFTSATGTVSVVFPDGSSRAYRAAAQAVRRSTGGLYSTVALPMETYLRGVVGQEASPSWKPAALQAQAVAARTYAAQRRSTVAAGAAYDICDSTSCQVFVGTSRRSAGGAVTGYEYPSTDAAIAATAGHIRTFGGRPAFTEFGSSNGGYSTSGGYPYLPARPDPWDGAVPNAVHSWTANLPVSALEARYPGVGHLLRLRVTGRDGNGEWGGRVTSVVLEGVDPLGRSASVATTGEGIYAARSWPSVSDGLRSSWWHIESPATTPPATPVATAKPSGTATTPVPALRASLIGTTTVPTLVRAVGRTGGELVARFQNTGTRSWTLSALRLAPVTTADTALTAASAAAPARDLSRSGGTVLPGDAVEVRARLDAGAAPAGSYLLHYQLMAPGFVLSGPVTSTVPVRAASYPAAPGLFATVSAVTDAPLLSRPTGTGELVARFRNAGTKSWSLAAIRLTPAASKDTVLAAPGTAPAARNISRGGATVLPGDQVEVRIRLTAANHPAGSYRVDYRLMAPGFLLSEPVSWPVTVR